MGLGSGLKFFFLGGGPTYVDYQLWAWKYSHIFLLVTQPGLGPFFLPFFWALGGFVWVLLGLYFGLESGSKISL